MDEEIQATKEALVEFRGKGLLDVALILESNLRALEKAREREQGYLPAIFGEVSKRMTAYVIAHVYIEGFDRTVDMLLLRYERNRLYSLMIREMYEERLKELVYSEFNRIWSTIPQPQRLFRSPSTEWL